MTQYNIFNVKLSYSQFTKLKARIKNNAEVTLKISSNFVGDSNDENNFPHKFLLTNTQVSRIRKALQVVPQLIYNYHKHNLTK